MDFQPTTRYPSLQLARLGSRVDTLADGTDFERDDSSPVVIDGLDVVDEQVVLLSPIEPTRPTGRGTRGPGRPSRTRYPGGTRHGMG